MKRKKLLKEIAGFLDMKGRKQRKHRDDLESLLEKLQKKTDDLEQKRLQEKGSHRRRRLDKELVIVRAQYAKGAKALQDLDSP